jgi:hypothetical protein
MSLITLTGDLKSLVIPAVQIVISVLGRMAGIGVEQRVDLKVVGVERSLLEW